MASVARENGLAPEIDSDDFARRFALRPGQLMWFLGAGASVSAGVPTAWDMIWQFKQILYARSGVPLSTIADTGNPSVRALLDAHVSGSGSLPVPGAPDEYAALFEAAYPAEKDRRTFIDGMIGGAKPAYGHLALAALLKAGHAHLIWTTNFDHLVADACAQTYGTTKSLSVVALDAPDLAAEQIAAQQWPIEVKLHGDFRSRRLKNTPDELRQQDAQLREVLVDSCRRSGLVVGGIADAMRPLWMRSRQHSNAPAPSREACFGCIAARSHPSNASTSCSNAPRRLASTAGWSVSRIWTKRFAISCVCCLTSTRQRSTAWVRSNAGGQPPRR
ncbi:hypothetical protein GCM10020258_54470 [Sphingomonas yabuuchiae]